MSKVKEPKRRDVKFLTFPFEFKEVGNDKKETEGVINGYASTFGNIDLGFDRVMKGAFKKTLSENKGRVPVLADHNPYDQIGWGTKAKEDNKGLQVEAAIMLDVQKGKERYTLAKKAMELGTPAGISIGYATIKAEPDSKNPRIRNLVELKLYEYSLVTFPMNTEAMVTAAKSVGVFDKLQFLIKQLETEGISKRDLEIALHDEAAKKNYDPTKVSQALDDLILKFKS